jgi:hypothetical protein
MRASFGIALLLALFVVTSGGWAGTVPVTNSSFEAPVDAQGAVNSGPVTGWVTVGAGNYFPVAGAFTGANNGVPDGNEVGWANAGGSLSQILSTDLAAGTTYTLSVDVGLQTVEGLTISPIVDLYAGSTLLGSLTLASPGAGNSIPTPGTFDLWTLTVDSANFSSEVGDPLKIYLGSATTQTDFDNVTLTASALDPVEVAPEPAMFALVGAGLLGLVTRRRFAK